MNRLEKSVLNEILLEITLAIGSEYDYTTIIEKTLSLWMRRLNCTMASILEVTTQQTIVIEHIVPSFLIKKGIPEKLKRYLLSKPNVCFEDCIESDKGHFMYSYRLYEDHIFVFQRQTELTKDQYHEMFPVTQFFGRSLEGANEKKRRISAEYELEEERRLLKTVIDNIPDAVYLKDNNLRKVLTNKADLFYTGYADEKSILNKTDREVYEDNSIAYDSEQVEAEILDTGQPVFNRLEKISNRNGYNGWIETSKIPLRNSENEIVGIIGIGRNVTEQKAINERIERLSLVASQTTNGVIITDVKGRVEWINEGFTRLTGYTLEEMKGRAPGSILQGPESDPEVVKLMRDAITNQKPFDVNLINYKKDGTPYHIKVSCNPMTDEDGDVSGFMAIESDVSEVVRNRQQLIEARNQAIKAQQAEKKFLANMSHEIRTPLNAIIGMTSLLADTPLDEEQGEYLNNLELSSKFLLALISDTLDLAKIEAGKIEVKKEVFDLEELVNGLVGQFALKAAKKDIKVTARFVDVPRLVIGDQLLLLQILNNLVSNAEKFTDEGSIYVIVDRHAKYENNLRFRIKDTGIGISQEDLQKLFKKFNQLGSGNQIFNQGSGLGLNITKELVELLGGEIIVKSEVGVGSEFSFHLPLPVSEEHIEEKPEQVEKIKQTQMSSKEGRILIAEDNKMNQLYVSKLLQKYGLEFDMVENGLLAVEHAEANVYSVILMDIQMPVMDGYEAIQKIRKSAGVNSEIPILALTASALVEIKEKAFRIGVTDFISKPFTPTQLRETLGKYIELA